MTQMLQVLLRTGQRLSRRLLVVLFALLGILLGSMGLLAQQNANTTYAAAASPCASTLVRAAESTVPLLNVPATSATAPGPVDVRSAPAAATVNGSVITSAQWQQRVQVALAQHQLAKKQLPADAPASALAEVNKTPKQIRQDMLDKLIEEQLLLQEGQRQHITASAKDAASTAATQLATFRSLAAADPGHVSFQAFLCVNHLDEQTFLSNPAVLQSYQDALTIRAVQARILARLPLAQQRDQQAVLAALQAETVRLRRAAKIQVLVSI